MPRTSDTVHRSLLTASILLTLACRVVGAADAPKPGDLVLQTDFDTPQERQAWSKASFAQWQPGYQDTTSLVVTVPADRAREGGMIRLPSDLARYRGCRLLLQCMAKAQDVSKPAESWLGVKFMLHYQSASEGPYWQNQNDVFGTFDWRPVGSC